MTLAQNEQNRRLSNVSYSSSLSGKASLLLETKRVLRELAQSGSIQETRKLVVDDNILAKDTLRTRRATWEVIHQRFISGRDKECVLLLARLISSSLPERARHLILFYELARALPLVYDLTVGCLFALYQDGRTGVDKADVLRWLGQAAAGGHSEVDRWSPQTRSRVVSHYLALARDFGLVEGVQRKVFTKIYVPLPAFLYVLYSLKDQGLPAKSIVQSSDFRLFLMDLDDVVLLLYEASRRGYVQFQQAGEIYDLDFNYSSLAEVMDELISEVSGT